MENKNECKNVMEEKDKQFLDDYFSRYEHIFATSDIETELFAFRDLCERVRNTGNKLIFAGNGASASISSHASTDFTQHAEVRAVCFNDHNLITAFSNDYGYENWIARALEAYADPGDVIVLVSSSGESPNVVNAAKYAKEHNLDVVTFSGFSPDNHLRTCGIANFWVDSHAYNIVESTHLMWILSVANLLELGREQDAIIFLKKHAMEYKHMLFDVDHTEQLVNLRDLCVQVNTRGGKMIFAGNGGSSSIASHAATDFTKQSKVRTVCFNDHNLISAFSNDYGQEKWIAQCIELYADSNDAVVLISSSGQSANIINAAILAKKKGLPVITFTGFDPKNPVGNLGDENFWVDSRNYNTTEVMHAIWICCVVDMLVGNAEYAVGDVK